MASGTGAGRPPQSNASWSPPRYQQGGSNNQPPSPVSVNNVPRSSFVPEIVIPRRTSSSSPAQPNGAAATPGISPSYSSGTSLLRPPSQQARFQQQQQGVGNGGASSYPTHYSTDAGSSRQAYDAPAPSAAAAQNASHEDSLADVMGSSGVDLRAEEEAMQYQTRFGQQSQSQQASSSQTSYRGTNQTQGASSTQPKRAGGGLFLEVFPLSMKVHNIAAMHGLGVDPDVLIYLSLAARTRFRNLTEAMIAAARHRIWSTAHSRPPPVFQDDPTYASTSASALLPASSSRSHKGKDRSSHAAAGPSASSSSAEPKPMYHEQLLSDPSKQLSALEKAEREEEARARRRRAARVEREAAEQAFLAAVLEEEKAGGGSGGNTGGIAGGSKADVGRADADGDISMGTSGGTANGGAAHAGSSSSFKAGGAAASPSGGVGESKGSAGGKSKKNKAGLAGGDADSAADGSAPKKKKQKKNPAGTDGPNSTGGANTASGSGSASGAAATGRVSKKYNLSEDVQKRLTDSTATQLIGGKAYGWMSGTGGAGAGKGKKAGAGGKSKLPAPRFGAEDGKKAEEGDGHDPDDEEGHPSSQGRGGSATAGGAGKHESAAHSSPGVRKRSDSHVHGSPFKQGLGGGGVGTSVGAWGDVAARKAAREEAERQRRLRVQMRDALFVLEEEINGGVQGRGAGARALMRARAKLGVVVQNPFEPAGGAGAH